MLRIFVWNFNYLLLATEYVCFHINILSEFLAADSLTDTLLTKNSSRITLKSKKVKDGKCLMDVYLGAGPSGKVDTNKRK